LNGTAASAPLTPQRLPGTTGLPAAFSASTSGLMIGVAANRHRCTAPPLIGTAAVRRH